MYAYDYWYFGYYVDENAWILFMKVALLIDAKRIIFYSYTTINSDRLYINKMTLIIVFIW